MASIITTAIVTAETPNPDQGIQLSSEDLVYPLPFLDNWDYIEITARFAVNSSDAISSGQRAGFGVCHGKVNPFKGGATTCVNFAGFSLGTTWTYNAGPPPYYTASYTPYTQRGTYTGSSTGTSSGIASLVGTNPKRTILSVLIKKTGTPLVLATWNTANTAAYPTFEEYMDWVYQRDSTIDASTDKYIQGSVQSEQGDLTFTELDESTGTLDHLNFSWPISQPLVIYDLRVRRWR